MGLRDMDMSKVVVRMAKEADCAAISDLVFALAEYEKLAHLYESSPEKVRAQLFGGESGAPKASANPRPVRPAIKPVWPPFVTWF